MSRPTASSTGSAGSTTRLETARIPASPDFIRAGCRRARSVLLQATGGKLEARAFRLVAPLPDEEQRWNRETRECVARGQAARCEIDASYWEGAQLPVLPGQWATAPLVPYVRSWMDLVLPISAPQGREAGAPLKARMFLNELESVQLGVYANGRKLEEVTITVDPLRDRQGKTVAEITPRVAEYARVKGWTIPNFFIEPYPQRLWPAYPFALEAGRSHSVWLALQTKEDLSKAGRYSTLVHLTAKGLPEVTVPLEVEIIGTRLLTMDEAGLGMGGCTTGLLPEFELEFLKKYNHNMINIWYAGVRPTLSKQGDGFGMDFRIMDAWMAAAKRAGVTRHVYFLGGNPYGFPGTMHLPRTLAMEVQSLSMREWEELAWKDPDNVPPRWPR